MAFLPGRLELVFVIPKTRPQALMALDNFLVNHHFRDAVTGRTPVVADRFHDGCPGNVGYASLKPLRAFLLEVEHEGRIDDGHRAGVSVLVK